MKDLIRSFAVRKLKTSGFSSFAAKNLFEHWWEDFRREKRTTLAQKLWAYRRGFYSSRIPYYGLTEENYRHYISDFDYMRLHPINGSYSKWIDDKLTIRYLLAPFAEYLPEYYFHIYKGELLQLPDCPGGTAKGIAGVLELLRDRGGLATKLAAGSRGDGFHKLEYHSGGYWIDRQPSTDQGVRALLTSWLENGVQYLLTEYLQAHNELNATWGEAPGALRLMVGRQKGQTARLMLSFYHIATSKTGVLNTPGGVSCIVDVETGYYSDGKRHGPEGLIDTPRHPDTNVLLEGTLPNWALISQKIIEIHTYLPQLRYAGYDVVITERGFKIIEINSHAGLDFLQNFHPVLGDELTRDFFNELLAEVKRK